MHAAAASKRQQNQFAYWLRQLPICAHEQFMITSLLFASLFGLSFQIYTINFRLKCECSQLASQRECDPQCSWKDGSCSNVQKSDCSNFKDQAQCERSQTCEWVSNKESKECKGFTDCGSQVSFEMDSQTKIIEDFETCMSKNPCDIQYDKPKGGKLNCGSYDPNFSCYLKNEQECSENKTRKCFMNSRKNCIEIGSCLEASKENGECDKQACVLDDMSNSCKQRYFCSQISVKEKCTLIPYYWNKSLLCKWVDELQACISADDTKHLTQETCYSHTNQTHSWRDQECKVCQETIKPHLSIPQRSKALTKLPTAAAYLIVGLLVFLNL